MRAHKIKLSCAGRLPTRINGVTNLFIRGFFISFKVANKQEKGGDIYDVNNISTTNNRASAQ